MKCPKNMKSLAREICARNGKKKRGDLWQQTEDLAHLCDILWEYPLTVVRLLCQNAVRRNGKKGEEVL